MRPHTSPAGQRGLPATLGSPARSGSASNLRRTHVGSGGSDARRHISWANEHASNPEDELDLSADSAEAELFSAWSLSGPLGVDFRKKAPATSMAAATGHGSAGAAQPQPRPLLSSAFAPPLAGIQAARSAGGSPGRGRALASIREVPRAPSPETVSRVLRLQLTDAEQQLSSLLATDETALAKQEALVEQVCMLKSRLASMDKGDVDLVVPLPHANNSRVSSRGSSSSSRRVVLPACAREPDPIPRLLKHKAHDAEMVEKLSRLVVQLDKQERARFYASKHHPRASPVRTSPNRASPSA